MMLIKRRVIVLLFLGNSICFAQHDKSSTKPTKSIAYIQKSILTGIKPDMDGVEVSSFESDYRSVIWSEPLSKAFQYNNEKLNEEGYTYIKKNVNDYAHQSFVYKNCDKGIIIEITEWYKLKLTVSIEWYGANSRSQNIYLMWCYY